MDPSTRRLALLSGGLGGILVLIVGYWSVSGQHDTAIPVIQADKTPLRVKPDNPGGLQVTGMSEDFLAGNGDTKVQAIVPPPERPDPKALRAPAPKPVPVAVAPVVPPPPPAVARPAPPSPVVARAEPASAARAPQGALATGRSLQVQLASMSSEQAAHAEWERLSRRMPALLGKRRPEVVRADVNGRVFWRLRTNGFEDVAQASSFCEHVRLMGGDCSVASF